LPAIVKAAKIREIKIASRTEQISVMIKGNKKVPRFCGGLLLLASNCCYFLSVFLKVQKPRVFSKGFRF